MINNGFNWRDFMVWIVMLSGTGWPLLLSLFRGRFAAVSAGVKMFRSVCERLLARYDAARRLGQVAAVCGQVALVARQVWPHSWVPWVVTSAAVLLRVLAWAMRRRESAAG